jgi:hypothetical protein
MPRRGLPRLRGDRPHGDSRGRRDRGAPPPTRGSTPDGAGLTPSQRGSPAYAGIDPRMSSRSGLRSRLPRLRGDRPGSWRTTCPARRAPPPMRGSTPRVRDGADLRDGSPAYAGIDPLVNQLEKARDRLPRLRGDRPDLQHPRPARPRAPPPTRGSTPGALLDRARRQGFPAYAGIDRFRRMARSPSRRLPRLRGDRPAGIRMIGVAEKAPPPTRGSTRPPGIRVAADPGSPAYAGMNTTFGLRLRPSGPGSRGAGCHRGRQSGRK